jgi:hypothetical protein
MKKIIFLSCLFLGMVSCNKKTTNYLDEVKQFQYEMNIEYNNPKTSPLTKEDLKTFKSLDFFPVDKKYQVVATLKLMPDSPIMEMQTTTTELQLYKIFGVATFQLDGKKFNLNLYQSQDLMNNPEYADYLFLPFNDLSNGKTTYGGGRFLDLKLPPKNAKTIIIDFNKAYNPYCAYSHRFSCPIPPKENNLKIKILSGVKAYKKD